MMSEVIRLESGQNYLQSWEIIFLNVNPKNEVLYSAFLLISSRIFIQHIFRLDIQRIENDASLSKLTTLQDITWSQAQLQQALY